MCLNNRARCIFCARFWAEINIFMALIVPSFLHIIVQLRYAHILRDITVHIAEIFVKNRFRLPIIINQVPYTDFEWLIALW